MRSIAYGIGACLCILSILFFLVFPRTPLVPFLTFWILIVLTLCVDCRKEQLRKERIQRNINTTGRGFLQV